MSTYLHMLVFGLLGAQWALAQQLSISGMPAYVDQRTCVKDCLWADSYWDLPEILGCEAPWRNDCYCRPDLRPTAHSWLSRCLYSVSVYAECADQVDYRDAVSLYDDYCGYITPATSTRTVSSSHHSFSYPPAVVTTTDTYADHPSTFSTSYARSYSYSSMPTATSYSYSSTPTPTTHPVPGSPKDGLSRSDKINIIIGVVVPVVCAFIGALLWKCCI